MADATKTSSAGVGDILGGAASIGTGIIGFDAAQKQRDEANSLIQSAMQEYIRLGYPPDLSQELAFKEMKQAGVITPEMEAEIKMGPTSMEGVTQNQELLNTRKRALGQLQEQARTGLTPEERAQMNALQRENDTAVEAKRQQIVQDAQSRGLAGGGQELAGQYIAAQSGANRAQQASEQVGANASRRALEALGQGATLAGQMGSEQLGLDTSKAQARDMISKFNTENAVQRQTRNVNRSNDAQMRNLAEKQRLQDINTAMQNQEKLRANEARRTNWTDNLTRAKAIADSKTGAAANANTNAAATAKGWQNIATGAGGLVKAGYDAYGNPKTKGTSSGYDDLGQPTNIITGDMDEDK